jgi:hypothetical protein
MALKSFIRSFSLLISKKIRVGEMVPKGRPESCGESTYLNAGFGAHSEKCRRLVHLSAM